MRPSATAMIARGEFNSCQRPKIAGFSIIETTDLDAALDWASRVSLAIRTPIEVRPFMDLPPR